MIKLFMLQYVSLLRAGLNTPLGLPNPEALILFCGACLLLHGPYYELPL